MWVGSSFGPPVVEGRLGVQASDALTVTPAAPNEHWKAYPPAMGVEGLVHDDDTRRPDAGLTESLAQHVTFRVRQHAGRMHNRDTATRALRFQADQARVYARVSLDDRVLNPGVQQGRSGRKTAGQSVEVEIGAKGWTLAAEPVEKVRIGVPVGPCLRHDHDERQRHTPPPVLRPVGNSSLEHPVSRAPGIPSMESHQALHRPDETPDPRSQAH